jgi:CubicO group peptidase (beta-lactamase class C family)
MPPAVRMNSLWKIAALSFGVFAFVGLAPCPTAAETPVTRIALVDGRWHVNGALTHRGTLAEGRLMNVRMANATFEDANPATCPPGFDAEANADRFIARIPEYVALGVDAFTLCLQGGMPGYEGAINSAFTADGALQPEYLGRVERVIRACDRHGAGVILGLFYQRQARHLRDADAVRTGVVNALRWVQARGFTNVLVEIANEYPHKGFAHDQIRTATGQAELLRLAKATAPEILVTASGLGTGTIHPDVAAACDFLTPHWNGTKVADIPARLAALQRFGRPIVVNEDDKTGAEGVAALQASVAGGAGYGLMHKAQNQTTPFRFEGAADDPVYYAALQALTSGAARAGPAVAAPAAGGYFPPPDAAGGWRTVREATEVRRVAGMNPARLDEVWSYLQGTTRNGGLAVVRHGWLVYERYFGLGHRAATPNLASCGKSFTSVAIGMLRAERPELFYEGLDQEVFTPAYFPAEMFPLSDPRMARIKLGQLLAFTAGIRGNNPSFVQGREVRLAPAGPDGWEAMVDTIAMGKREARGGLSAASLWCEPGTGYSYASASIHLASVLLRHVTGQELELYLRERLAGPLGWGAWGFGYKNSKEVRHTPGAGGICLRSTDMLRFGYLLLREGRWQDKQIVPGDYVRQATRRSPYNPHYPYSLQFNVNTGGEVPDLPRDAFWKSGSGGHALYVVPSLDLVVWKLGGRDDQYAPTNTGLPESPAAADRTSRPGWREIVPADVALRETLRRVVAAIEP